MNWQTENEKAEPLERAWGGKDEPRTVWARKGEGKRGERGVRMAYQETLCTRACVCTCVQAAEAEGKETRS